MPEDKSESKARFREIWEVLYPLYMSFREELFAKSTGYQGMIYRKVAEDSSLLEDLTPLMSVKGEYFSILKRWA